MSKSALITNLVETLTKNKAGINKVTSGKFIVHKVGKFIGHKVGNLDFSGQRRTE